MTRSSSAPYKLAIAVWALAIATGVASYLLMRVMLSSVGNNWTRAALSVIIAVAVSLLVSVVVKFYVTSRISRSPARRNQVAPTS